MLLSVTADGRTRIIIKDQNDFELLQEKLDEAINKEEDNITVYLAPGRYYYKKGHLLLKDLENPKLLIQLKANNAILIPEGIDYINGSLYKGEFSIYRGWIEGKKDVSIWSSIKSTDQLIEIIDYENKICRLKSQKPLLDSDGRDQYILITQWYKSDTYSITKIEDNYIYFTVPELPHSTYKKTEFSINDDYNYLSKYPRYKLCNVDDGEQGQSVFVKNGAIELPSGISKVHECKASSFLGIKNCRVKQFNMDGMEFWGSSYGYPDAFITINNTEAKSIIIGDCKFYGMHNNVIAISNTDNVTIDNNLFSDFYYTGVQSDNKSVNTRVINNSFYNAGLGLSNTFCIYCSGHDYYISGNKLENYGYGGIRVGLWYRTPQHYSPNGIVEKNTLLFTDDYLDRITTEGLMDGGAIYISSINDKAVVRYNYINGYGGAGGNRGVFCDDGALGYEIYGNVILNISQKDYCIASRREPSVEKRNNSQSELLRSNINNTIRDNLLDGKIMFRGHEAADNGCVKGMNYIVLTEGEVTPVNQIDNIPQLDDDYIIEQVITKGNKILMPRKSYGVLRKTKEWRALKKYINRM